MPETSFSVNDLFRRRRQTSLVVLCLTLSVASTLFLLLFSSRLGVGLASVSENVLTGGLSNIFAQFIWFVGALIFLVGAVLTSFIVFFMMTQRTRDFGLIKAIGCPNYLLFGYYVTEVLIVTAASCSLGVVLGLAADYALSNFGGFMVYHNPPNLWFAPFVFIVFFILAAFFGGKPILDATRLPPSEAFSTVQYYGLTATGKAKPFTKSRLTVKVALRSLFRRKTATVRITLLLSVVFILLTVSVAGSIIANETTTSWVQTASGQNVIGVAEESMATQYESLQSAFLGTPENVGFNYTDQNLAIPANLFQRLAEVPGIVKVDARLLLMEHVTEVANFTIDPDTMVTSSVGDHRESDILVEGVEPANVTTTWYTQGRFLNNDDESSAVVGYPVSQTLFSQALSQSMIIRNQELSVVGVCIDPISNGRVIYVPLQTLEDATGLSPNIVLLAPDPSANRNTVMNQVTQVVNNSNSGLVVFDLNETVEKNVDFLGSTWATIMVLPLFTLASAALCLMAYVILAIDEQRQEFGFLRAMGAKPKTVTSIVAIQSIIILLASSGVGLSLGTIATLLVLMQHPVVTGFTIVEISAWLLTALAAMFILSLIPALRFAKTPLLKIMT